MSELYFQLLFGAWTLFILLVGILLGVLHERTR